MISRFISLSLLVLLAAMSLQVTSAQAQATRTWVSGVGDDVNPCSRTAPCKTFAGAISKTSAGGEINCIDPGGFGALTITKAIAIICDNVEAGVLVSGTNAINVSAGANDVVYLRGLDFEGLGTGLVGIQFNTGAALHVEKCIIRGFQAGSAMGINFAPQAANSRLTVTSSFISDNGTTGGTTGGGIFVKPSGSGSALAVIEDTTVANNITGIRADGTGNQGVKLSVNRINASGNAFGGVVSFTPTAGSPVVTVMVDSSTVSNNLGNGLNANGGTLWVARSIISGNATSVATSNGGTLTSYGDNDILGNGTNTLPGTMTHQ
jgi:hypothetical protein